MWKVFFQWRSQLQEKKHTTHPILYMKSGIGGHGATDSGSGILLGSTLLRKSLLSACSAVQRRAGSRVSMRSSRSKAGVGKLCRRGKIVQLSKQTGGVDLGYSGKAQHGSAQGKLLPQPPSVLLLGFHGVEEGKFNDVRPDCRTGAPAQTAEGDDRRTATMGSETEIEV